MAEIGLQCSGIDALVGQSVAAGMPEHVGMDFELNFAFVAGAGEQLGEARRGERALVAMRPKADALCSL
jgi:hypothetical protein